MLCHPRGADERRERAAAQGQLDIPKYLGPRAVGEGEVPNFNALKRLAYLNGSRLYCLAIANLWLCIDEESTRSADA